MTSNQTTARTLSYPQVAALADTLAEAQRTGASLALAFGPADSNQQSDLLVTLTRRNDSSHTRISPEGRDVADRIASLPGTTVEGFTALAGELSAHYGETVTRQKVYNWWNRETKNADGQTFPAGIPAIASANRPNRQFNFADVLAWTEPGVPVQHGNGWQALGSAA